MRAIILAAGRGSRMGEVCHAVPKCMIRLRGKPLIAWQILALKAAGIDRIAIVTGWQSGLLDTVTAEKFHNREWERSGMVSSLRCAAPWLEADSCIVSYSDIFYSWDTVRRLASTSAGLAIAYDPDWLALWSKRFSDPLVDAESFKVDADGRVIDIGRRMEHLEEANGQYMGLLKFGPSGWREAVSVLDRLPPARRSSIHMTHLLSRMIAGGSNVEAVPVAGDWGEIDTPSDLALYERELRAGRLSLQTS